MCKILNVDFEKKHLEYSWQSEDELREINYRKRIIKIIDENFKESIQCINALTKDDIQYQKYCSIILGRIIFNLKNRGS